MNWMGGSRKRFMVRDNVQKQREFFKKQKMQQKMKKLGLPLPTEAKGASSGSMDLVTLFIVNQISAKKENRDPPKITHFTGPKGGLRSMGRGPLELPMSPGSPSRLNLGESQPRYSLSSVQGIRKREFKWRQLSPVLESGFSDNSASDYQPHPPDPASPFSSSSVSSGQGLITLQPNLQLRGQTRAPLQAHCSPLPWDTPGPDQAEFIPFSQPGGMRECAPWSQGSNTPQYELNTPAVVRALFGSTEPASTEARDPMTHRDGFSLDHSESKELMLGFTLDQSEVEKQIELELFSGLGNEEYGSKAGHLWENKSKIFLREETPNTPSQTQNAIGSQNRGAKSDSLTQLADGTDVSSSHPGGHTSGPLECWESVPGCCLHGDDSSSASEDECFLPASSYPAQGVKESLNPNKWTSQQKPPQQHWPVTPQRNWPGDSGDEQRALESPTYSDSAYVERDRQGDRQTEGSYEAQPSYSLPQNIYQSKAAPTEIQDTGTQTTDIPARQISDASTQCSFVPEPTKHPIPAQQTFDASTQCSFLPEPTKSPPELVIYNSPVDNSTPNPATRGQAGRRDAAVRQKTHSASSSASSWKSYRRGEEHTPWSRSSREQRPGSVATETPTAPFLDAQHSQSTDQERGRQNRGALDEKAPVAEEDLPEEERADITSTSESRVVVEFSDEIETLQGIAGTLLLMLKQRKREG